MIRKSLATLTAVALTAAFATVAGAQTAPRAQAGATQDPPELAAQLRAKGEAYSRAPDSEQDPAEVATTAQLNAQIAAQNDAGALMEQRGASVGSEVDAEFERANERYLADKAAHDARQAEYMRARETWDGLIQACVASGRRDCTPTPPPADMPPPPPSSPPQG